MTRHIDAETIRFWREAVDSDLHFDAFTVSLLLDEVERLRGCIYPSAETKAEDGRCPTRWETRRCTLGRYHVGDHSYEPEEVSHA